MASKLEALCQVADPRRVLSAKVRTLAVQSQWLGGGVGRAILSSLERDAELSVANACSA